MEATLDIMEELGSSSVKYVEPEYIGPEMIGRLKKAINLRPEDWNDYISEMYLIRKLVEADTLLFLYEPDTFIAFEVLLAANKRSFLNILWSGGEDIVKALPSFNKVADHVARQFGCEWIEMTGRVGWARHLKPFNFKTSVITLRREAAHVLRRREPEGNADH